jgi:hypothetical protein
MTKRGLLHRFTEKIRTIVNYGVLRGRNFNGFSANPSERELNRLLSGYPRNHNYRIINKNLIPSFKLYERWGPVCSLYPENLESFLDIGCCRGFYVMEAAQRPFCKISVGLDAYEPFIAVSQKVKDYLDSQNARFYPATLDTIANSPEAHGGPFQTVLLIGTYHYLFWGSGYVANAYLNHNEILCKLSRICTDRLIFSARLEVDRLPDGLQQKAQAMGNKLIYNTAHFLEMAGKFFEVYEAGYLGRYPLFLMIKKNP